MKTDIYKDLPREVATDPDPETAERIKRHLATPSRFPLSDKEQQIFERWHNAWTLQFTLSLRQVISMLQKHEPLLSYSQARRAVYDCVKVFGEASVVSKAALRGWMREYGKECMVRARAAGKLELEEKFFRALMDLDDLKGDQDSKPDFSRFQPPPPRITLGEGAAEFMGLIDPERISEAEVIKEDTDPDKEQTGE